MTNVEHGTEEEVKRKDVRRRSGEWKEEEMTNEERGGGEWVEKEGRKLRSRDWDKRWRERTERSHPPTLLFRNGNGAYRGDRTQAAAEHATADPSHVRGTKVSLFFFPPPRQGGPSCDQRKRLGEHGEGDEGWDAGSMGNMKVDFILCVTVTDRHTHNWQKGNTFDCQTGASHECVMVFHPLNTKGRPSWVKNDMLWWHPAKSLPTSSSLVALQGWTRQILHVWGPK